jgi:hypothetical protein
MKTRNSGVEFYWGELANKGQPWSAMDDSDLLDFDEQRKSIEETAEFLQRTEDEVRARIEALKPKATIK